MTTFSRLLALLLLLAVPLSAQDAPAADEKKSLLIRFTAFGIPDLAEKYALSVGEDAGDPFEIPDNGFSAPQPSPGDSRSLSLGIPATGPESAFKPLLPIVLPEVGRRFLVILFPSADGLRSTVIRADNPAFRKGDIMIFNLSVETLAADLGGQKMRFAPGSTTSFRPKPMADVPNYQVSFYSEKEGKAKLFAANMWPRFDHKRAFVFLYVDPATSRPTYRSIDEFTEWLDAPGK